YSPGGALSLEVTLGWATAQSMAMCMREVNMGTADPADLLSLAGMMADKEWFKSTPLAEQPLLSRYLPWLSEVLAHPARDDFWQSSPIEHVNKISTPVLHIAGWYDLFIGESLASYKAVRDHGMAPARDNQILVIGPWSHGAAGLSGVFPDR